VITSESDALDDEAAVPLTVKPHHKLFYRLCVVFSAVFLAYVWNGYYYGIGASFPEWPSAYPTVAATFAVAIVLYLVLHAAAAYHRARSVESGRLKAWVGWYLGLFAVSGLGFVLASFLLFEGPTVIRENLAKAVDTLTLLQTAAGSTLPVADYDAAVSRLRKSKVDLHEEINNVAICGVGDSAKAILEKIRGDIPGFPILRDSDKAYRCSDPRQRALVADIADQYDRKMESGIAELASTPRFLPYRIADRKHISDEIARVTSNEISKLKSLQADLAGVWTLIGRADFLRHSMKTLEAAATSYNSEYDELVAIVGRERLADLPPTLDVSSAETIISPASLISNIVTRSGRTTTWMYISFALIADGLAAYMWSATMLVLSVKPGRGQSGGDGRIPGTDVRYLWTSRPVGNSTKVAAG
jgi:hypothetical protein